MFIAQRFLFWITSLIAFAHVSQVQAQTYTFEFSLTPLQPAVVTDYVFTPPPHPGVIPRKRSAN